MRISLLFLALLFSSKVLFGVDYLKMLDNYSQILGEKKTQIKLTKQQLAEKEARARELYRRMIELDRDIISLRKQLRKIQRQQQEKQKQINEIERKIQLLKKSIAQNAQELDEITARLEQQENLFKKRLLFRYKLGKWWALKFVFLSKDFEELTKRVELLNILSREDYRLIQQIKEDRQRKIELISQLKEQKEKYDNLLKIRKKEYNDIVKILYEKRQKMDSLKKARYEKQKLLQTVRKDRQYLSGLIKRLQRETKALTAKLKQLEKKAVEEGDFAKMKGRLSWPVDGEVVRNFGLQIVDPEGKAKIFWRGISIKAAMGTPVRAVYDGVVKSVGIDQQTSVFGLMVVISHGLYFTAYGYLGDALVKEGAKVKKGDIIGTVGRTGFITENIKDRDGILYFSIEKGNAALDPLKWLKRR